MAARQYDFWEVVSCPVTGTKFAEVEPWLYEAGESDLLYPVLCGIPVLQPDVDEYLRTQKNAICSAMAEWGDKADIRSWYFSRYGVIHAPESYPMDTEVRGDGYPGFWQVVSQPEFVNEFLYRDAQSVVAEVMKERHPGLALDLACGQGGMAQVMSANCTQVMAVEHHFYLAALAQRLLKARSIDVNYLDPKQGRKTVALKKKAARNVHVVCADIRALPFNEPLFDWVHCGHVMDLIPDPAYVLSHIMRILKPGGTLSICAPWDFEEPGHFRSLVEMLEHHFSVVHEEDGVPWLQMTHKRKFTLLEDWVWVGKMHR